MIHVLAAVTREITHDTQVLASHNECDIVNRDSYLNDIYCNPPCQLLCVAVYKVKTVDRLVVYRVALPKMALHQETMKREFLVTTRKRPT